VAEVGAVEGSVAGVGDLAGSAEDRLEAVAPVEAGEEIIYGSRF
jgi:hypothetical protein